MAALFRAWRSYLLSLAMVSLAVALGLAIRDFVAPSNLVMLFLLAVVVASLRWGRGPSILAAVLSVLAFDFFFVPPQLTLAISDSQYLLTFVGLLVVGLVISSLAAQVRAQVEAAGKARVLEATERLQSALLNSISHDLRTPLASITGVLSSLRDDEVQLDDATRRELVDDAYQEAERLNRLVGNLLNMSRLEGGALRVTKAPGEIPDLIGAVLGQLNTRLGGRAVKLDIPEGLPLVPMDFTLMAQALANVLDNAVKYSRPETPIEISARYDGGAVIIEIRDRGIGIPDEDLGRIFEKFYRVQRMDARTAAIPGTGLGLSISKGIVEAHGGRIQAANRDGGGATFNITLPLEAQA